MELPPFLSSEPMQGEPPCSWTDFMSPKLRRFPRDGEPIRWAQHLGHGGEGTVEAVTFGEGQDLFALKTFFHTAPLPSTAGREHGMWSLEGEVLTVASLEQVCNGLRQASCSPSIFVPNQRISRVDALSSLYACSAEGRVARIFSDLAEDQKIDLSALFATTSIRRCYGWVRLGGEAEPLGHLNPRITAGGRRAGKGELVPARFEAGRHHYGLVYEYVPAAELEVDAVQRQTDFFYYAGFKTCQPANSANWQGPGVKLDFGDYRTPVDPAFEGTTYYIPPTQAWFILGLDNPSSQKLSDEQLDALLEEEDRKALTLGTRARAIETAYCARYYATGRGHRSPPVNEEDLLSDIVHGVRIPEVEPATVRKVWKEYRRLKKKYLKWLSETGTAEVSET